MTKTNKTVTRSFAGVRAQRSRVLAMIEKCENPVAKAALKIAIEEYDRELANAPVRATKAPADRKLAAAKAWRTMLARKMVGTRGKVRAELAAKLAKYDAMLAA